MILYQELKRVLELDIESYAIKDSLGVMELKEPYAKSEQLVEEKI